MRKLHAFYATLATCGLFLLAAVVKGVTLTGDNIVAVLAILTALFTAFAGGNAAEHWSKKGQQVPVEGEAKS